MAKAIDADEVRSWLSDVPDLEIPDALKDPLINTQIERATARVLEGRGHTSLPDEGTQERHIVDDTVLELTLNKLARYLQPDNPEFLDALRRERDRIATEGDVDDPLDAEVL